MNLRTRLLFFFTALSALNVCSQDTLCDSLNAKIRSQEAVAIAVESQYSYYPLVVHEIKFVQEDSLCCWKITLADRYAVRHHGHYARTYRFIWIDVMTGTIIRQEGSKKIEGYYRE